MEAWCINFDTLYDKNFIEIGTRFISHMTLQQLQTYFCSYQVNSLVQYVYCGDITLKKNTRTTLTPKICDSCLIAVSRWITVLRMSSAVVSSSVGLLVSNKLRIRLPNQLPFLSFWPGSPLLLREFCCCCSLTTASYARRMYFSKESTYKMNHNTFIFTDTRTLQLFLMLYVWGLSFNFFTIMYTAYENNLRVFFFWENVKVINTGFFFSFFKLPDSVTTRDFIFIH